LPEERVSLSDVFVARKRLAGHVLNTPLKVSTWLSEITQAEILLKLENLQVTGSFKFRGALNSLAWAREKGIHKIFTASAGNHALGVAEAARITERDVTVCLPVNASQYKRQRIQKYSVGLIQHGDDCEVTEAFARRVAGEKKALYLSPYNNSEVIAGQGTLALEIFDLVPKLSTIIIAVGGGGLASGVGLIAKTINPKCRVVGVVAANSPTMKQSIQSGRIVKVLQEPTLADGIAGNIEPDTMTFPLVQEFVDEWVTIDENDIVSTIFEFLENEGMLIEGSAACAIAVASRKVVDFKPRERVAIVVCGGNISRQDWREIVVEQLVGSPKSV